MWGEAVEVAVWVCATTTASFVPPVAVAVPVTLVVGAAGAAIALTGGAAGAGIIAAAGATAGVAGGVAGGTAAGL